MSSLPHRQFAIDASQSTPPVRDQQQGFRFPPRETDSHVPTSPPEFESPPPPRRREPGRFDPTPHSRVPQPMSNENYPGASSHQLPSRGNSLEITPRYLQDALDNRLIDRTGRINTEGTGVSSPSDVSSLSPSEPERMDVLSMDAREQRASQYRMMLGVLSPLEEEQRLSNVPTIFDVASRQRESRTTSGTEPSYEVPGSHSTSTRADGPLASQSGRLLGSAPILSQTAGAAVGTEVISGNRTLEISSYGSEDTAPRKRHYEGCMLCDPLPSPSSSVSSAVPDFDPRSPSRSGPPPNVPLPDLILGNVNQPSDGTSTSNIINTFRPYLEGEVAPAYPAPAPTLQAVISDSAPPDYFNYPRQGTQLYALPDHRGSLSTLMEGDEESHQASHTGRQSSQDAARIHSLSSDQHRPHTATTTGTASHIANLSQSSLIAGVPHSDPVPPIPTRLHPFRGKGINPFKASPLRLSSIDETRPQGSRKPSWRGLFGREETLSKDVVGASSADIELRSVPTDASGTRPAPFSADSNRAEHSLADQDSHGRPDRTGGDAAYENVDLENRSAVPAAPPMPWWKRSLTLAGTPFSGIKMQKPGKWVKWGLIMIGIIGALLMVVLPILFIGFPAMAQAAVDNAAVDISSISITGVEESSLRLAMELRLNPSEPMNVFLGPENLRLTTRSYNKGDYLPTRRIRRNHLAGHYSNDETGILGYLKLAEEETRGNDVSAGVILKGNNNGRFVIGDVRSWGEILEQLIFREKEVEVQLQGKVQVKTGGLKASCQLKKDIKLPGIGGLNIVVTEYDILKTGQENFTAVFELGSKSKIEMDFGTVNFQLLYGDTAIGTAMVEDFKIFNGTSKMTARGSLSQDVIEKDPNLLGRFLSSLFLETNHKKANILSLQGVSASVGGTEIEWLTPAIRRLQIPLPAVAGEAQKIILEDFDLGFSLVLSISMTPRATDGFISSRIKLPFPAGDLNPVIKGVSHRIQLHDPKGKLFAHLLLPVYPAAVTFDKEVVDFKDVGIRVFDERAWSDFFLKSLFREKNFKVSVTSNITVNVDTRIGNASVENVKIAGTTWNLDGYGGFTNGGQQRVELTVREFVDAPKGFLKMRVNTEIFGAATLPIKLGPIKFRMFYNSTSDPMGQLDIRAFSLANGRNNLEGYLYIDGARGQFDNFMTSYFAGGGVPLLLDPPDASALPAVTNALRGLNISSTINSPGYSGFLRGADFMMFTDTGKGLITQRVAVVIMNPLLVSMAVETIDLSMRDKGSNKLVAEVSTIAFTKTWINPGDNITVHLSIYGGYTIAELFDFFETGSKQMELDGIIGIGIGTVSAKIRVNVGRVVGLNNMHS